MTGIEILATKEIAVDFAYNWIAYFICFGIILAICLLIGIVMSVASDDSSQFLVGLFTGIVVGGICSIIAGALFETPIAFENQYKVTISDEVSMNEFTNKYEVIEQEGRIYTVREK